jgi:transcriptional regulator with XRE-family HTH domain
MNSMAHIRKNIFKLTQPQMAAVACVAQSLVSRWETGDRFPDIQDMDRIRKHAHSLGIKWDDSWFFEAPPQEPAPQAEAS